MRLRRLPLSTESWWIGHPDRASFDAALAAQMPRLKLYTPDYTVDGMRELWDPLADYRRQRRKAGSGAGSGAGDGPAV